MVEPLKPSNKTLPVKDLRNIQMIFESMSKNGDREAYINLMNNKAKAINQKHNAEPRASIPKASSPRASSPKAPGTLASKSNSANAVISKRLSNSKASSPRASSPKAPGTLASKSNSTNAVIPKRLSNSKASNSNLARLSSPKAERKNKYLSILYRMNDMKNKYIQELKKNREIEKERKMIKQYRTLLLTRDDDIEEELQLVELQKLLKPVHNIDGKYINGDSNM
jgi:hypothetical protein